MTIGRLPAVLAWLLPAAVLATSGALKLIAPDGTPPRLLLPLTDLAPYTLWLRALGLGELVMAAAVVWPATRRRGLAIAASLLAVFSLLVGISAADLAFVGDCGCFAGLGSGSRYYGWLVLRNGGLVALAVLGARSGRPLAWTAAGLSLLLAVSVPGVLGELQLRRAAYRQLDATAQGERLQGYQGRRLPDFDLVTPDGHPIGSDQAFGPGDLVAFVARSCPHCLALAPALAALDDSLRAEDRRVVLVLVNAAAVPHDWRRRLAWQQRDVLATLDREVLLSLGMDAVPRLLQLGPEREIQFNEAHPLPTSLWKSLVLVDTRAPGTADAVWRAVAAALFGDGAAPVATLAVQGGMVAAPVVGQDGLTLGRLCVVQDGWRPADLVELAVGLDPDDRLVGVLPLSLGAYARVVTPTVAVADSLQGLTLGEADSLLALRSRRPGLEAPVWRSLRRALQRVEPVTRSTAGAAPAATPR